MKVLLKNGILLHLPDANSQFEVDRLLHLKRGRIIITVIPLSEITCVWWDAEIVNVSRVGDRNQ